MVYSLLEFNYEADPVSKNSMISQDFKFNVICWTERYRGIKEVKNYALDELNISFKFMAELQTPPPPQRMNFSACYSLLHAPNCCFVCKVQFSSGPFDSALIGSIVRTP